MADWLLGVVLGIVQGVSEWLPISSKTQIIIASTYLYHLNFKEAYAFGLFLEFGTFFAALAYFRKEAWSVLKALVGRGDEESRVLLKYLLVVTAITAVIGVAIYVEVSDNISGPVLGIPMVILGSVLIADGIFIRYARREGRPSRTLMQLTMKDWVAIGIAQGIAAFPGVSRSGATVSTMLLLGVKPKDAFKLSFLALIPVSIGATIMTVVLTHVSISGTIDTITLPVVAIAVLVTIVVGLGFINILLRWAGSNRISMLTFALGVLAIAFGIFGILYAPAQT